MSVPKKDAAEAARLRREIVDHDRRYYIDDNPDISDSEYDALIKRLLALEARYPELISPQSPTQRVGGGVSSDFKPARHARPMLSLDNAYLSDEVRDWQNRLLKNLAAADAPRFVVEPKIDGLSCALTYEKGVLIRGATRGDGEVGEDISANVRTLKSVPLALRTFATPLPEMLEIRGEVVMYQNDFKMLNEKLTSEGKESFVNARNCAAGSLRQKDPKITAQRKLRFIVHSFGVWEPQAPFDSHSSFLKTAQEMGFRVEPHRILESIDAVIQEHADFQKKMSQLPYAVDGLVVKVDAYVQQRRLGYTA